MRRILWTQWDARTLSSALPDPASLIRNLYLTGQDVVSLGVTGALLSGFVTASAVLRRNLISTLAKSAPKRAAAGRD